MNLQSKATLNNQTQIPFLGLGVYMSQAGQETQQAVLAALEVGYRHIDTAKLYENEKDVGLAVSKSGINREEIFITTKLWNSDHGYHKTLDAAKSSLDKLGTYIDLYLIHWPVENLRLESWKAMEELVGQGDIKAIGVSNYTTHHLQELLQNSQVLPVVNQVEYSPFLYQKELRDFCHDNNILLEAYSPLTRGKKLNHPTLQKIANTYNKSIAQILIRWCLQQKIVVLPKSVKKERIIENADVFDFEITTEDMYVLNGLDENFRTCWDPTSIS